MADNELLEWEMKDKIANEAKDASLEVTASGQKAQQAVKGTTDIGKKEITSLVKESEQKLETVGNRKIQEIERSGDMLGLRGTANVNVNARQVQMGQGNTMIINEGSNNGKREDSDTS